MVQRSLLCLTFELHVPDLMVAFEPERFHRCETCHEQVYNTISVLLTFRAGAAARPRVAICQVEPAAIPFPEGINVD